MQHFCIFFTTSIHRYVVKWAFYRGQNLRCTVLSLLLTVRQETCIIISWFWVKIDCTDTKITRKFISFQIIRARKYIQQTKNSVFF